MADYPEIMKAAAENELFTFGNHTYSHPRLTGLSEKEVLTELKKTDDLFYRLTGMTFDFVRPPFGDCDAHTLSLINRPLICWSLDTMSWDHGDPAKCIEAIHKAKDGDIVLMHDFQEADVFALSAILDYLQDEEFTFKSIPELLGTQLNDEAYIYYSRDKRAKVGFNGI
ncbi:polysaccharide deacetylase family protein [Lactococcus lactis]